MSTIVLDTNILVADYRLKGAAFAILVEGMSRHGWRLAIPMVVFDELMTKFTESVTKQHAAMMKSSTELCALDDGSAVDLQQLPGVEQIVRRYRQYITGRFSELSVEYLPYPTCAHADIVAHVLARKKPFGDSDAGYRDFLVWYSVVERLRGSEESVAFVSNNTRDFCDRDCLHEDLLSLVRAAGAVPDRVEFFRSIRDFNDQRVIPALEKLAALRQELSREAVKEFSLRNWVRNEIAAVLAGPDLPVTVYGLDESQISVRLTKVDEIKSVAVDGVRQLPSGDILISGSTTMNVTVATQVDGTDYLRDRAIREAVDLGDGPFGDCSWDEQVVLDAKFKVVVDSDRFAPRYAELDSLEGPAGAIEIDTHVIDDGNNMA